MIRVVIGHRGKLVRGALAAVLTREADMSVVAEYERAEDVLKGSTGPPGVVLLDPLLPGKVAMAELCHRIRAQSVLLLIDREDGAAISLALSVVRRSPTVGVIATDVSPDDLVAAVREVAAGRTVFDASLALAAWRAGDSPLTEREGEVLRLISTGATVQEVARGLSLSAGTIRNYLSRILTKTDARSRIEAMRKAQEAGWI